MSNKESPITSDFYKYVVGIDFGTTFSGAGYIFIKNANSKEVVDINKWPKNETFKYQKVPTVITYHKSNPDLYKCGAEAMSLSQRPATKKEYGPILRLFKLLLDPESDGVPKLPEGLPLVKVIADYLRDLHKNILKQMMSSLSDDKKISTIRYCLTVPAIWNDEAKTIMREAAIQAGIVNKDDHPDRLLLIGEPEAAALYSEKMRGGIQIKSDETLMICDCGGGTIDITTYKKTIEGKTISFKQITISCGNLFGSSQLDKEFREYVWRMIGKEVGSSPDQLDKEQILDAFEKEFIDIIKANFGDDTGAGSEMSFLLNTPPQLANMNISKDGFRMSGGELETNFKTMEEEVFKPIVREVLGLIRSQLRDLKMEGIKLNYIILVGGFGQSQYLNQKIREEFEQDVEHIVAPSVGELAVTRGAVFFGLNPYSITHRRMKISYGFGISAPFKEGVDKPEFKVIDKTNKAFCKNRFDVCVKKGQDVSLADSIKRPYYTFNSNQCHIKLYGFKGDNIPRYVSDDPDAAKHGEMAYKVADFVLELPEQARDDNKKISFDIEVFFGHMEIRIEVDVPGMDEKLTFMAYYENESSQLSKRSNTISQPLR